MAEVDNVVEMWPVSAKRCAQQKECHAQCKNMAAISYISDPEEIAKVFWSDCQHYVAAMVTLP